MNEEKDKNQFIEANKPEQNQQVSETNETKTAETQQIEAERARADFWRRIAQPRFVALAILICVLIVFAVIYLLSSRKSQVGQIVPMPRTVNFGQSDANFETSNSSEEKTLTLDREQIEQIKLETQIVGETLSSETLGAASTGVVQANAYAETPVIPLVGGVIRNVSVQLGDFVRRGETIAVVYSDELAQSESNYLTTIAEAEEAGKRYSRALELTDVSPEARTELDQATAAARIAEAEHTEHLSHFKRTQKLLEIGAASREEFEIVKAKHESAQAKLDEAEKRLERARQLLKINPERRNEIDRTLAQLTSANAKVDAERQKLLVLGLSPQKINQIKQTRRIGSDLPINSPVSGTITMRQVNSGEIVSANEELFKITNLGIIWVIAEVYEKDLSRIRTGSGASVTSDAFPGRVFRGRVTYIDPNIKQETRTAQVRVELENPGQIFKIGMYVNVAFGATGTAERTSPVVPAAAVQTINNKRIVFLATENPNVFKLRQVDLGSETDGGFVVSNGINVGDRVVTNGSFLLRAEWQKLHPEGY